VTSYAQARGMSIVSINMYGPSLEDVFIRLTGLDVHSRVKTVD